MKAICVVTGTRAEYGLLKPLIERILSDTDVELELVVTGSHLSDEFGTTYHEIENDGFRIHKKIKCVSSADTAFSMTKSTATALSAFADYFEQNRTDMLVLLGDRYEIFACAVAAAMVKIPIAHIFGGDTTVGAMDEFFRHSITKMSYLHFTSTEEYKHRVEQLGESPDRVFNVGSLGVENVLNTKMMSRDELSSNIDFCLDGDYAVVTFHPVTMERENAEDQFAELLGALDYYSEMKYIITKANSDAEGRKINAMIDDYSESHDNCFSIASLGLIRYLSALRYAKMVIGNSSSGIYEVPSFGIPTINIGDRQKGRIQADSVINCLPKKLDIIAAINKANNSDYSTVKNPYQGDGTSLRIFETIKYYIFEGVIDLKKIFYDIDRTDRDSVLGTFAKYE